MRSRTTGVSNDPLNVIDESLLYEDFDVERFLKSVEKLDVAARRARGRRGTALRARREFPPERDRPAQRGR
ncbi:MAG TPA: hypothetical protein VF329_12285 [Gammaproteobacteria bacterium]